MKKAYVDQISVAVERVLAPCSLGTWLPVPVYSGRSWSLSGAVPLTSLNLWYEEEWTRLEWTQEEPGSMRAAWLPFPWEDAREYYRGSPNTAELRIARSRLHFKWEADSTQIYVTDERQARLLSDEVIPKRLPELLGGIKIHS